MQLRDYQEQISTDAAKLLEWTKIAYLSMQVRTGKTATALATAQKYGAKIVLFVTKKKAISSIEDDFTRMNPPFIMDVINYEQLGNLVRRDYDLIIVDEAHCISQFPTPAERTKLLKEICAGKPILYLSGTPTPESFSQLYHQLWISDYSPFAEWPTFYKWVKAGFVTVRKKYLYNREIQDYSFAHKDKIDEYTKHLFISFTQEQAGFEQMIDEEVLHVEMKPTTYKLVETLITDRIFIGKEGQEILGDTAVKLQNKIHQIYSGTVLPEEGEGIRFDYSKATYIKSRFKGQKIAIFYKFKSEGAMIKETFDNLTEDPMEFNERSDKTFYSQVQSGREGINLSTADALVFFNIDFSSVSYQQARARIQSQERTKEAKLYWIFSRGGIEEKIYERVIKKLDFTTAYFKQVYKIKDNDRRTQRPASISVQG